MTPFINFSELYNSGGTFHKQEVLENGNVTTIYGGYAPRPEAVPETEDCNTWLIRKLVVVDDTGRQDIECTWARGAWTNRASLNYQYYKP